MADDAGPPVVLGESPTPDGADAEVLPEDEAALRETEVHFEDEAALRETEVPFEDEAALRENEVPFEDEAALREIPADLRDDQFPTFEHEVRVSDLQSGRATTEPDRATAEPFAAPGPGLGVAGAVEHPTSVLQVPRMRVIDLLHLGNERVIGCWQVDDILIDPGPASCLEVLLGALEDRPRALLLTHIHLDHAGATGSLVKRWPDLEVYVHEQGAPHLAHPARLLESAQRLYGDDMERLWGEFLPVPEANLHVLSGGEKLFNGRFEVAYTPGHASHHVSYRHEQTAFVGDVAGVRITPETLTVPPTPPPDIDIEGWHASIDQLLRWKPERLAMTHFGANDDIGGQLADLADRLDTWAALVHTEDLQTFVGIVEGEIERGASAAHRVAYKQAAPPEQIYAGLERYWRKREGGAGSSEGVTRRPLAGDDVTEGPRGSAAEPSTHAGRSARASRWAPRSG
jgi:glyoxylase-like metal-dependent hydrolase (beta-lactamase superfamily II)